MGHFSVKLMRCVAKPDKDAGVMIDYGFLIGTDEKKTNSERWVELHNQGDKIGSIWVHGHNMGNNSLSNGKTYSFTI